MATVPVKVDVPETSKFPEVVRFVPTSSVELKVVAPVTFKVPSTTNPSLMLIVDESVDDSDVPFRVMAPTIIFPVPAAFKIKSEFDVVVFIMLSVILMLESKLSYL